MMRRFLFDELNSHEISAKARPRHSTLLPTAQLISRDTWPIAISIDAFNASLSDFLSYFIRTPAPDIFSHTSK